MDMLFQLIEHLQRGVSVAQGRRILLDYIRKASGAKLGLVFVFDKEDQVLRLLEQSGQRPHQFYQAHPADAAHETGAKQSLYAGTNSSLRIPAALKKQPENIQIPLHGLFGSALHAHGFLHISDVYSNPSSLEEEKCWTWHGGSIILSAVGTGRRRSDQQGVLVLSFGSEDAIGKLEEGNLFLCISLLSAYLSEPENEGEDRRLSAPKVSDTEEKTGVLAAHEKNIQEAMIRLGEIGLIDGVDLDARELHQRLLAYLCRALNAQDGCLWLYHFLQKQFKLSVTQGDSTPFITIGNDKLERFVMKAGSGLFVERQSSGEIMIFLPLECRGILMGALAFSIMRLPMLSEEQHILLVTLGKLMALILRNAELRLAQQQALIDRERHRFAHDMHDGTAQNIAHTIHKLEFIRRIFEKQPESALRELSGAQSILEESLKDVRHEIASLLPVELEKQGFQAALQSLLDEFVFNEPQVEIDYNIQNLNLVPPSLEVPIYRFLQEALNNVRKHAQASEITIHIRALSGRLIVQVSDNGVGFQPGDDEGDYLHSRKVGLRVMHERIGQARGTLDIRSIPGEGTTLKARFPLGAPSAVLTSREREVLRLLVEGSSNRAIAQALSVSIETVKSHVRHIMQKMQVKDRTQAAVVATKQRWL